MTTTPRARTDKTPAERVARAVAPCVAQLRELGTVRSVQVDDKPEHVDVVVRLRVAK